MADTKIEITTEMVDAALDAWSAGDDDWCLFGEVTEDWRRDMRAALTAAFALVTPGAGFRAGAEWAAGIIERGQQTFGNSTRSLTPRVDGNMDGLAYADAIRTALAAMPFDRITALYDAESSKVGDDISVSLAVKLVSAEDEIRTLKTALASRRAPRDKIEALRDFRPGSSEYNRGLDDAMRALAAMPEGGDGRPALPPGTVLVVTEEISEAAETVLDVANYLKGCLDRGLPVFESKWLDGLMEIHGTLLGIAEPIAAPPAISPPLCDDAGGGT